MFGSLTKRHQGNGADLHVARAKQVVPLGVAHLAAPGRIRLQEGPERADGGVVPANNAQEAPGDATPGKVLEYYEDGLIGIKGDP